MAAFNLKRLISKPAIAIMLKQVMETGQAAFAIADADGKILWGQAESNTGEWLPVELEGQLMAKVWGSHNAPLVVSLLTHLITLDQERRILAQETLERYKEITFLTSIADKFNGNFDLGELSNLLLTEAKHSFKINRGFVLLLNSEIEKLQPISVLDFPLNAKDFWELGKGIIGTVAETGIGEIVNEVAADPRVIPQELAFASLLCTPLKYQDQILGVLTIGSQTPFQYTASDLKLLATLASQAVPALIDSLANEFQSKQAPVKYTTISVKDLRLVGSTPIHFEVTLVNQSSEFATFLLDVTAAGTSSEHKPTWYHLSPKVSTKQPPGATTRFEVQIVAPPIPDFVGSMNLTVRIFSLELGMEERHILRLLVEPDPRQLRVEVELPVTAWRKLPQDRFEILVRLKNPHPRPAPISLMCLGLAPGWLVDGVEQKLHLYPGQRVETCFICEVPNLEQAWSQVYPLTIQALVMDGVPAIASASLEVLPTGQVDLRSLSEPQRLPAKRWFQWKAKPALFDLELENRSNLIQQIVPQVELPTKFPGTVELSPPDFPLDPGQVQSFQAIAQVKRPWWGWWRTYNLPVTAPLSDSRLGPTVPDTQPLTLRLAPRIPPWLQLGTACGILSLLWWFSWLNPDAPQYSHRGAVNSVQFDGQGHQLITGANDRSLMEWQVRQAGANPVNQKVAEIGQADRAVRVVRYRPVQNNQVAAGLENGDIQLWNLAAQEPDRLATLSDQKDDRVLALQFSDDAQYLFSGHGSGQLLQWWVAPQVNSSRQIAKPLQKKRLDFAIYALALVDKYRHTLAVGGRYNQLTLWDWQRDRLQTLPYRRGSQADYITSLASAPANPYLLAVADTQGQISLWNLQPCLTGNQACDRLEQWSGTSGGQSVRSLALSADGCYLASGGDDGRVMIWPLDGFGRRSAREVQGIAIAQRSTPINTLDLIAVKPTLLIATGENNGQVRLFRYKPLQSACAAP